MPSTAPRVETNRDLLSLQVRSTQMGTADGTGKRPVPSGFQLFMLPWLKIQGLKISHPHKYEVPSGFLPLPNRSKAVLRLPPLSNLRPDPRWSNDPSLPTAQIVKDPAIAASLPSFQGGGLTPRNPVSFLSPLPPFCAFPY